MGIASQLGEGLDSWYVGDTVGDIVEGKESGVGTIAVTWGWQRLEALAMLAAAESLRGSRPVLAGLSARDLRSACRPFWSCNCRARMDASGHPGRHRRGGRARAGVRARSSVRHVLGAYLDAEAGHCPRPSRTGQA